MKNFVHIGDNVTIPAPATVTSGEGVLVGSLFGIAATDATTAAALTLSTTGVFELPKVAADEMEIGEPIYWDDTAKLVTVTATDNTKIGVAVSDAGNGAASVRVRLNGAF